jgi:hypothetical protein
MASKGDTLSTLQNEYSACQASIHGLEANVWQSAALFGLASITSLALVASSDTSVFVAIVTGTISSFGTFVWWRLADRWWSILDANLERMRHIEEDLKVRGRSHYIAFLDALHDHRSSRPVPLSDPQIAKLATSHRITLDRARLLAGLVYQRRSPKDVLWPLPWLTAGAWLVYLAVRIAAAIFPAVRISLFFLPMGRVIVPGA